MPESYSVLEACQVYIIEYTQVTIIDRRIGVDQDFIDLQHNCQLEVPSRCRPGPRPNPRRLARRHRASQPTRTPRRSGRRDGQLAMSWPRN